MDADPDLLETLRIQIHNTADNRDSHERIR